MKRYLNGRQIDWLEKRRQEGYGIDEMAEFAKCSRNTIINYLGKREKKTLPPLKKREAEFWALNTE